MAQANPLRRLPLRLPHLLGVLVVLIFLPWVLLTGKSEREIRRTIETFEPFQLPEFPLQFSRTMEYDSLGFLGRGVRAGFWKWTPEGMVLAEKGRAYFTQTPSEISTVVGAGRRVISKLQGFQDREGRREVRFRYRWTKVTPPAPSLAFHTSRPERRIRRARRAGQTQWPLARRTAGDARLRPAHGPAEGHLAGSAALKSKPEL